MFFTLTSFLTPLSLAPSLSFISLPPSSWNSSPSCSSSLHSFTIFVTGSWDPEMDNKRQRVNRSNIKTCNVKKANYKTQMKCFSLFRIETHTTGKKNRVQTSYSNMSVLFVLYRVSWCHLYFEHKRPTVGCVTMEQLMSYVQAMTPQITSVWFQWTETIERWAWSSHENCQWSLKDCLALFHLSQLIYCWKDFPQWSRFNNFCEGTWLKFHSALQIW